jgi:hypothetical protein
MADLRDKILHRRSPVLSKRPTIFDIEDGELAINYYLSDPGLYFKDVAEDGTRKIRKIGPIHFGNEPPNSQAEDLGFPIELSNGECWIDTTDGSNKYLLKVWKSDTSQWVEVGAIFGRKDDNLDQFLDGEDGDNFVHTDGIKVKINNKTALAGFSSDDGDILVINEDGEFGNGTEIQGQIFRVSVEEIEQIANDTVFKPHEGYVFTTDSASGLSSTLFGYTAHGLFNTEKVYVLGFLSDGVTPSPVPEGEYFVSDATSNSFKLKTAGGTYVNSSGNIRISYSPEVVFDRDRNILYSGNLGLKSVDDIISSNSGQLAQNNWDVFYNPTNSNVRVFARAGNDVHQIQTSVASIDVKSAETTETIAAGDPVFYVGLDLSTGLGKVGRSKASDLSTMRAIGIATKAIAPGQRGSVTLLGEVKGIDTATLPGRLPGGASNIGRVVFVRETGGLTLSDPDTLLNVAQAIGILMSDDGSVGSVMVNHPSSFVSLPNLPEDYIWAGVTGNEAVAHRLLPTSFKRSFNATTQAWEIGLSDNVEFGAYRFASDAQTGSKVEIFVDTTEILSSFFTPVQVDKFSTSYRSAKYLMQISGTSSDGTNSPVFQVCEILAIHNGSQASVVEYGTVSTYNDERLGQFDAKVENSEVVLTFQKFPLVSQSVAIKAVRTSILV